MMRVGAFAAQRGIALIMAMVILLILTLIGITALGTTSLEARMANSTQQAQVAFQAAESGLAYAETKSTPASQAFANSVIVWPSTLSPLYGNYGTASVTILASDKFVLGPIPRSTGSGIYGTNVQMAHLYRQSTGSNSASSAQAIVTGGIEMVVAAPPE